MPKESASDLDPTQAGTVFDIDALRVARVYAEALFNAADKAGMDYYDFIQRLVDEAMARYEHA